MHGQNTKDDLCTMLCPNSPARSSKIEISQVKAVPACCTRIARGKDKWNQRAPALTRSTATHFRSTAAGLRGVPTPTQRIHQVEGLNMSIDPKKKLFFENLRLRSELYFRVVFRGWECSYSIRSDILLRY